MAKDINGKPFDEATKLKLDIFAECFREWLPVFIENLRKNYISKLFIYDFFAGSGSDSEGHSGSPIILLKEAKGENCKNCNRIRKENSQVIFAFNEKKKVKCSQLDSNIKEYIKDCLEENCKMEECIYKHHCKEADFKDIFHGDTVRAILENRKYGKFLLLDQYGYSQVDEEVFRKLISYPFTDFIFFISSSLLNRFKGLDSVERYINAQSIAFDTKHPENCHKVIARRSKSGFL